MLERESVEGGWQVRVPTGGLAAWLARLVPAAFLGFWLCGWAAGEWFAVGALVRGLEPLLAPNGKLDWLPHSRPELPSDSPVPVLVFLGVWVTLWTVGGVAAMSFLGLLLFGTPYLVWDSERVELVVRVGPFAKRTKLAWSEVAEMREAPLGMLVLSAGRRRNIAIGPIADPADREQVRAWLAEARAGSGTGSGAESYPSPTIG